MRCCADKFLRELSRPEDIAVVVEECRLVVLRNQPDGLHQAARQIRVRNAVVAEERHHGRRERALSPERQVPRALAQRGQGRATPLVSRPSRVPRPEGSAPREKSVGLREVPRRGVEREVLDPRLRDHELVPPSPADDVPEAVAAGRSRREREGQPSRRVRGDVGPAHDVPVAEPARRAAFRSSGPPVVPRRDEEQPRLPVPPALIAPEHGEADGVETRRGPGRGDGQPEGGVGLVVGVVPLQPREEWMRRGRGQRQLRMDSLAREARPERVHWRQVLEDVLQDFSGQFHHHACGVNETGQCLIQGGSTLQREMKAKEEATDQTHFVNERKELENLGYQHFSE